MTCNIMDYILQLIEHYFVIVLSYYAECRYTECRYAECRYAECYYAECRGAKTVDYNWLFFNKISRKKKIFFLLKNSFDLKQSRERKWCQALLSACHFTDPPFCRSSHVLCVLQCVTPVVVRFLWRQFHFANCNNSSFCVWTVPCTINRLYEKTICQF